MVRWLTCLLSIGILYSQDDGLPPNFVYLEPIEDFYSRNPISLEIIVTDRNSIERVSLFYRLEGNVEYTQREMKVSYQPVIFNVEIPLDEVESGSLQYFFWAKDIYGNEATWPDGGEDLPMVLPIFPEKRDKVKKRTIPKVAAGFTPPENLEDNLPYYLEVGMLAPPSENTQKEGVPIIVLSVFDSEEIVDLDSVRLLINGEYVTSFNSPDMITYVPQEPFALGYHIIRYESVKISGESLVKDFSFFMEESVFEEEIVEVSWRDKTKFKGDLGWNTDYDPSPNRPLDTHKINSSVKFQLGDFIFNISGLMNTHIIDSDAREEAKHRQPSTRLKFKMKSPYLDFHYGDNSPEFSEFSLKGTRVRGVSTKLKWGTWETSFVSGETKHWVDSDLAVDQISIWNMEFPYQAGNQVYDEGFTWIAITENMANKPCEFNADTCAVNENWIEVTDSEFKDISNEVCTAVEPAMYGLNPDTSRIGVAYGEPKLGDGGGFYWFWDGSSCEEELLYSSINMLTGEDGLATGELFTTYDACQYSCTVAVEYEKGSPIRYLQGIRTSKDFFNHAKFGLSAIRSWDIRNDKLAPYSVFHQGYTYEGNFVTAADFSFHFNHDKTVLSGEYGLSVTMDQTLPDTLLLKATHNIDDEMSLYSYADWGGVDYCFQNQCIDINGDSVITSVPELVEGVIVNDSLWNEIMNTRKNLQQTSKTIGINLNDDINGFADGRGISGLTGPEFDDLINGGLDSIHLLLKKPAFKISFKTPIPLYFTELDFQTELNQAPLNYISHGSSSIQTDVRNWKNKAGFKIWKNQMAFSFGYDKQIKSPWDPEFAGETIKRTNADTKSGSVGLSFRSLPGINYSLRLQDREDFEVQLVELKDSTYSIDNILTINTTRAILNSTVGLKKLSTHTLAPSYKLKLGETSVSLNGNITLVKDLDVLADTSGCYEILNSTAGNEWGGVIDTAQCGENENLYYFIDKNDNPLEDAGSLTSTYTGALSFSFKFPLSLNLGWGLSTNIPNDRRQAHIVITVYSAKIGYKLFDKKLNITVGGNYVVGFKDGNNFWDSGEIINSEGSEEDTEFNQGDTFQDKEEMNNNKLTLKTGIQYKMPEQKITIGLNLDYTKAVDHLKTEQEKPVFKAKLAIKYGF